MSNFSGSLGTVAIDEGNLVILENGYDVAHIPVPRPFLGADNNSESTTEKTEYFEDTYGNSYTITIYSSMYGGVDYEIEPETIVDVQGLEFFRSNLQVFFEEPEPEFDPWEYFSPEEIETGYEKRLRWSKELIDKSMHEISIIINVSSLETLMKDLFKSNSKLWFHHISDDELDTNIFQFVKVYNLQEAFLLELMKNSTTSKESKIQTLQQAIKDKLRNIDFQKTENQGSFNWLFNKVFGIQISTFLQSDELNGKKLKEHFEEMCKLRHKLIHGVDIQENIDESQSCLYYDLTKKVCDFFIDEMAKLNRSRIGHIFK